MIELRRLSGTEPPPDRDEAWVLIEKRDGNYYVSAKSKAVDPSPAGDAPVDSDRLAMKGAEALADLMGLEVIYWRDDL